jgi:hypothetical protein
MAEARDDEVALIAIREGRILVSWDRDFNHQRFQKPKYATLHRVAFACPEPRGAERLNRIHDRLCDEWARTVPDQPMLFRIALDKIQIRC